MTTTKIRLLRSIGGVHAVGSDERERDDYYATEPKAVELLLDLEKFNSNILEPCCGEGHISEVLKQAGYNVTSSDLIDRGYGKVKSLFDYEHFNGDIITNPPYKLALDCVKKSLDIVDDGHKVAMFLKIQFLESKARKEFFEQCPPKVVYVASGRLSCAKNGDFNQYGGKGMSYCWFIWEKGYKGDTILKWFN